MPPPPSPRQNRVERKDFRPIKALSTFYEKLKKICVVEAWFFSTFLPTHYRIPLLFQLHGVGKSPFQRLSLTERM